MPEGGARGCRFSRAAREVIPAGSRPRYSGFLTAPQNLPAVAGARRPALAELSLPRAWNEASLGHGPALLPGVLRAQGAVPPPSPGEALTPIQSCFPSVLAEVKYVSFALVSDVYSRPVCVLTSPCHVHTELGCLCSNSPMDTLRREYRIDLWGFL